MSVCKSRAQVFGVSLELVQLWAALAHGVLYPQMPSDILRSTSIDFAENQLFPSSIGFSNSLHHFRSSLDYTFNSRTTLDIPGEIKPSYYDKVNAPTPANIPGQDEPLVKNPKKVQIWGNISKSPLFSPWTRVCEKVY